MKLFTAAALIAISLFVAGSAGASVGKFNSTAKIVANGSAIKVSGPISFDSDELGAVVTATVVQNGVHCTGSSAFTSGPTWSATLSCDGKVSPGDANAQAKALVYLVGGGTEQYTWTVNTISLK